MFRLSVMPVGGNAIVVVLLTLFLIFLFLYLTASANRSSSGKVDCLMKILRIFTFMMVGFLLLRPSAVFTVVRPLPASLVFLFDQSASMSITDEEGQKSRFDCIKSIIADNSDLMESLSRDFDLRFFLFDKETCSLEYESGQLKWPEKPIGTESELGKALQTILPETSGKRVPAVLLFSDGSIRSSELRPVLPQEIASRFRDTGVPVNSIKLGKQELSSSLFDLSVKEMHSNDRVFKGNDLNVTGRLRTMGAAGREIPVEFRFEGQDGTLIKVGEQIIKPTSNEEAFFPFHFVYSPKEVGEWKLNVSTPIVTGELVTTNNELGAFVRVLDNGLHLLYLEGTRRFEQKYLRLALDSAAEIEVDYRRTNPTMDIRNKGVTEAERVAQNTAIRKSLTQDCFESGRYAAYILGDIDSTAFKTEEMTALAKSVSKGAGLIVLAGERSLSTGGYADSPLADLFPVELTRSDRVPLNLTLDAFDQGLTPGRRVRRIGSYQIELTDLGRTFYPIRLTADLQENIKRWSQLPKLDSIYRVGTPKSAARIIAKAISSDSNETELPFIITQNYGSGRVTVVASDATRKWWTGGFDTEFRKFWRQLVLWSAHLDELPEGELILELDRVRFAGDEPVDFRVRYRPKTGEDTAALNTEVIVVDPEGHEQAVTLVDEEGVLAGSFRKTSKPGDYRIRASVRRKSDGQELQSTQSRFLVYVPNPELDDPAASPAILENISSISGGKAILPGELRALLEELREKRETLTESHEVKISLYDTWPVFLLLVSFLSLEWFWRKKKGLV